MDERDYELEQFMQPERILVTFKFQIGDKVRDTSWHEDRTGKVITRSYYENGLQHRNRIQYAVEWPDGGFTVPISEDCLELATELTAQGE